MNTLPVCKVGIIYIQECDIPSTINHEQDNLSAYSHSIVSIILSSYAHITPYAYSVLSGHFNTITPIIVAYIFKHNVIQFLKRLTRKTWFKKIKYAQYQIMVG